MLFMPCAGLQYSLSQPRHLSIVPTKQLIGLHFALLPEICVWMSAFATVLLPSVRSFIAVGGGQMSEQRHGLRAGVVATPGRFIDHLQQGNTNLAGCPTWCWMRPTACWT
jgi:superfamily II DNA/RNA helicase